jgi:hypothetical protein
VADSEPKPKPKPKPKKGGPERRRIKVIAAHEWLDPFSGKFVSADYRISPHSGAKRVEGNYAELDEG